MSLGLTVTVDVRALKLGLGYITFQFCLLFFFPLLPHELSDCFERP